MLENILIWIQDSPLGYIAGQSEWGYPIVLACHAVGMAIVVGTLTVINLRVLGFVRDLPLHAFSNLVTIFWVGVILNIISGFILFCGDPERLFYHPAFWIKLLFILIGALCAWYVVRAIPDTTGVTENTSEALPSNIKLVAALSLILWPAAIIAGRLIAYIEI